VLVHDVMRRSELVAPGSSERVPEPCQTCNRTVPKLFHCRTPGVQPHLQLPLETRSVARFGGDVETLRVERSSTSPRPACRLFSPDTRQLTRTESASAIVSCASCRLVSLGRHHVVTMRMHLATFRVHHPTLNPKNSSSVSPVAGRTGRRAGTRPSKSGAMQGCFAVSLATSVRCVPTSPGTE
jgi:hypothetical protein